MAPRRRSTRGKNSEILKGKGPPLSPAPLGSVPPAPSAQPRRLRDTRVRPSGNRASGGSRDGGRNPEASQILGQNQPEGPDTGVARQGPGTSSSSCGQVVELCSGSSGRRPGPFSPHKVTSREALRKGPSDPHRGSCCHRETTWPRTPMFGAPESTPPKVSPKGTLHPPPVRPPGPRLRLCDRVSRLQLTETACRS